MAKQEIMKICDISIVRKYQALVQTQLLTQYIHRQK